MEKGFSNQAQGSAAERPEPGSDTAKDKSHLEKIGWGESQDSYRMDANKLPWHSDRVKQWVGPDGKCDQRIAPLHIDMGITTGCNLACHFCYGVIQAREGYLGSKERRPLTVINGDELSFTGRDKLVQMPLEVIKNVFADAKEVGIRSIAIVGEGENTLNPALYPAVEFARDIEFDVSLATHGANIKKDEQVDSLMSSLQWLRVNISAATPESYERVHQRPWLDRVLKATELLVEGREKRDLRNWRGERTTLGYQMVLTKENFDQVLPLAKLGRDMGVDYTVIKACSDTPHRELDAPDKEYLEMVDVFKEAEKISNDRYQVVVRWNKLGNEGNKEYKQCHGTRFILAMSGDGTVFPCGHWFARERDRFAMGNVNEIRLRDLVFSDRYWQVQEEIHRVDLRMCETNCRQHACNQTLIQIAESRNPKAVVDDWEQPRTNPRHVNFV